MIFFAAETRKDILKMNIGESYDPTAPIRRRVSKLGLKPEIKTTIDDVCMCIAVFWKYWAGRPPTRTIDRLNAIEIILSWILESIELIFKSSRSNFELMRFCEGRYYIGHINKKMLVRIFTVPSKRACGDDKRVHMQECKSVAINSTIDQIIWLPINRHRTQINTVLLRS